MKLKKLLGNPAFLISAAGLAVLAAVYMLWLCSSRDSHIARIAAFISAALFAAVCLRFVPGWMDFWNRSRSLPCPEAGEEPPKMWARIFCGSLLYILGIIFAVYILRGIAGHGWSFVNYLEFWTCTDSRHYLDIARDWYLSEGHRDRLVQLVFLPGYPAAIRIIAFFTGNYLYSGLLVSALCFSGAACVFYRLTRLDFDHDHAMRALKFLCIIPGAFFFAAPMSESLFLLLSLSCIYMSRKKKWLIACILGCFAAFTRSLGMALFVPVLFELIAAAVREKGKARFCRFFLLLLIPLGFGAYCLINYFVSGDPLKYMEYQSQHWGQHLGLFFNTASYQLDNALSAFGSDSKLFWGLWLPNLVCSFAALILMISAAKNMRPSYTAYFISYYIVAIGATWLLSAPRYLAVMFTLPMALASLSRKKAADDCLTLLCSFAGALYMLAFVLRWQVW